MALISFSISSAAAVGLLLFLLHVRSSNGSLSSTPNASAEVPRSDVDLLEFPLNLEYLEAELFLFASTGVGLDEIAPGLAEGGPPPAGARKAALDPFTKDVIYQFALQEGDQEEGGGISKATVLAAVMDAAFSRPLRPPFDPYANSINFLLASYLVPYVGLSGYVGTNPKLQGSGSKKLVAGLLGVESGQDAVIRALLYKQAKLVVRPYGVTVAEFTNRISQLRNTLGRGGIKDEGLIVPRSLGAEAKVEGNVLAGDADSLAYDRTPEEVLRVVYGSGNESVPGGFFPQGGNGNIARSYLDY